MESLQRLSVAGNKIKSVNKGIQKLKALEYVNLNMNRISDISELYKFKGLPKFQQLLIQGNPIENQAYSVLESILSHKEEDGETEKLKQEVMNLSNTVKDKDVQLIKLKRQMTDKTLLQVSNQETITSLESTKQKLLKAEEDINCSEDKSIKLNISNAEDNNEISIDKNEINNCLESIQGNNIHSTSVKKKRPRMIGSFNQSISKGLQQVLKEPDNIMKDIESDLLQILKLFTDSTTHETLEGYERISYVRSLICEQLGELKNELRDVRKRNIELEEQVKGYVEDVDKNLLIENYEMQLSEYKQRVNAQEIVMMEQRAEIKQLKKQIHNLTEEDIKENAMNISCLDKNLIEANENEKASFNRISEVVLSDDTIKNIISTDKLLHKILSNKTNNIYEPKDNISELIINLLIKINKYIKKTSKYKNKLKKLQASNSCVLGENRYSMQENYKEKLEQVIVELEKRREELLAELEVLKHTIHSTKQVDEDVEESSREMTVSNEELNKVKAQISSAKAELNCLLETKENEMRLIDKLKCAEDELKERLRYIETFINKTEQSFKGLDKQRTNHRITKKKTIHY